MKRRTAARVAKWRGRRDTSDAHQQLRALRKLELMEEIKEVKKKLAILEREIPKRLINGKIDKMLQEKRSKYEPRQNQNQTYSTIDMVITMYELDAKTRAAEGTLQDKVCNTLQQHYPIDI